VEAALRVGVGRTRRIRARPRASSLLRKEGLKGFGGWDRENSVIGSGAARVNASRRGGISYHAEFDERSVTQKKVEETACK